MLLTVNSVFHQFGNQKVLHNIDLQVDKGQFVALVGPSGCGKSTLLRAILGTNLPSYGIIKADNQIIMGPSRHVGIVYQHYSLYEFLTVEENVAFGLKLDRTNLAYRIFRPFAWHKLRQQHLEEARRLLREVGLGHVMTSYPRQLSGGMRQRVAIAQALIMKPKLLLLDEPFGALDESTREDLQTMLLALYGENLKAKKEGCEPPHTVIFVTHELNEAFYLADRVIGLSRFWKDQSSGQEGRDLGATVVYDKSAPIFTLDCSRDYNRFADLKNELRQVVYNETNTCCPSENVNFWKEYQK